jgi:O-antigen/teichoic acid export membrane protein
LSADRGRNPSRRVATAWNVLFAYGSVALALVRNLALVPVFLYYIDADEFGAWMATGGVLAYLLMLDFGLMGVVGQRIAQAYGAGDFPLLSRRMGTSLAVAGVISLLSAALAGVISPLVPGMMQMTGDAADRLMFCFLIVALANGLNIVALATRAILRSLQRPVVPGVAELMSELVGIVLTIVLLVAGHGLYALAYGLALRSVVNVAVNGVGCLIVIRRDLGLRLGWDRGEARALWGNSFYQFFSSIAIRLQSRSDLFFVGLVLGPRSALVYGLTIRAHETVRLVATHFVASVQPSLAHLHGGRNVTRFREVVVIMACLAAVISCIGMAGVVAFNGSFMALWLDQPGLYGGLLLTTLVAVFGFVAELGAAQYGTLMALGEFRRLCRVLWEATSVRLPLLLVLLFLIGLPGAPIAAILSALLQTARLTAAVAKVLEFSGREVRNVASHLARMTLPVIVLGGAAVWWAVAPGTWIGLLLAGAAFSGVAAAIAGLADLSFVRRIGRELREMRAA